MKGSHLLIVPIEVLVTWTYENRWKHHKEWKDKFTRILHKLFFWNRHKRLDKEWREGIASYLAYLGKISPQGRFGHIKNSYNTAVRLNLSLLKRSFSKFVIEARIIICLLVINNIWFNKRDLISKYSSERFFIT